jgi:drug/metabolite transporter (DMT)-like permease
MKKMHLGIFIMIISAVTFSVAIILMKVIPELTQLPPEHVAIWRFIIGAPAFWILSKLHSRQKSVENDRPWSFIVNGIVFSVANFCAVFALSRLPSSVYVIILNLSPALVVLYALFTGRSVPKLYWLGLPLTMIGLILTSFKFGSNLTINPEGLIIALINAVAFSSFMILSEKVFTQKKNRIIGTSWIMNGAMLTGW